MAKHLQNSLIEVLAMVRILIKRDRTLGMKIRRRLVGDRKLAKYAIYAEIAMIKEDIQVTKVKSMATRDKIFGSQKSVL